MSDTQKRISCVLALVGLISAVMVIISIFLPYISAEFAGIKESASALNLFGRGAKKGYNISLICLIVFASLLAMSLMLKLAGSKVPMLAMFDSKMFAFFMAAVSITLLVFGAIIFSNIASDISNSGGIVKLGAGLIIELTFSIMAALSTIGVCVIALKQDA